MVQETSGYSPFDFWIGFLDSDLARHLQMKAASWITTHTGVIRNKRVLAGSRPIVADATFADLENASNCGGMGLGINTYRPRRRNRQHQQEQESRIHCWNV